MITIYCFSATGRSRKVAEYFAQRLNLDVCDVDNRCFDTTKYSNTAVIVFPVYCQNIPTPVKMLLPKIKADNFVLISTYGKKSFGNVIYEAAKLIKGSVIAAAYVPIGHTYLNENDDVDFSLLEPIFERIANPKEVKIPKTSKNPLADFLPEFRSRVGVRIKTSDKCIGCNLCGEKCVMSAIYKGKINKSCIRCLRCVNICPNNAFEVKYNIFIKIYLKIKNYKKTKIYL